MSGASGPFTGGADQPPAPASSTTLRRADDRLMRKAISVRQPWAWALIYGGKDVENRGRPDPWHSAIGTRLWVHAAKMHDSFDDAEAARLAGVDHLPAMPHGALIGSVTVVDVHDSAWCFHRPSAFWCSRWARPDGWHIVVSDPEPLAEPIPCRGSLGLFLPTPEEFR